MANRNQDENEKETGDDCEIIKSKGFGRSQVDDIIDEYKEEAHRRDTTPKATIYKYDHEKTGQDRVFAGYFTGDEIPNRHSIGMLYGSGRYAIQLDQPKGTARDREQTTLIFRIHETYDKLKAAADAIKLKKENALSTLPGSPEQFGGSQQQSFQMVKEILSLILPVMKEANRPAVQPPRQENTQEMFNSYAMMQKLLKTNLFDTAETYKEFNRRFQIENSQEIEDADEEGPQEREPGLLEKIVALIEPFFNLIASKSPAAAIAATTLRAAPQFVEVLNDPTLCKMIVQHFDRTKGREKADLALKNIGIDRKQLFAQSAGSGAPLAPRQTQPQGSRPAAATSKKTVKT